jgi:hypothetical protein
MRPLAVLMFSTALAIPCRLIAQTHDIHDHAAATEDSAFRAMQARGRIVMGVDQYTSVHDFVPLPDGGRIELQRDHDDSVGTQVIRAHLRTIARAFSAGEFGAPFAVHGEIVPGVAVLRARRSGISYDVSDLPRGAELRIRSADPVAIGAIQRFLAYQGREHRTGPAARTH